MNEIDHIAIVVKDPREAVNWYTSNFGAIALYCDDTWGMVQFKNIKLAFVIKGQHPPHIAFRTQDLHAAEGKKHRDGSRSVYKADPWGNILEYIKYKNEDKE
tara:strand:- start:353 stop:658 length:306 start_codon:yes stop_codon:yes gene_type:complete